MSVNEVPHLIHDGNLLREGGREGGLYNTPTYVQYLGIVYVPAVLPVGFHRVPSGDWVCVRVCACVMVSTYVHTHTYACTYMP